MKKSTKLLSLCFMLLIVTVLPATAQIATLSWDQNTQTDVIGYKIYYKTDTATAPFNGTSLTEGASPITLLGSATTSLTIDLPDDGNIYYFTATAISDTGLESSFSDIIASEWVPYLLAPTANTAVGTSATFSWDLPPTGYNVTYELHYGTDPNLQSNAAIIAPPESFVSGWPQLELTVAIPLAILLSLLMAIRSGQVKRIWSPVRIGLCIGVFVVQASCGGGGGEIGSIAIEEAPTTPVATEPIFTNVVTGISTTSYQTTDLQPGSEYYWKIVAVDNQGYPYESITQSFTTAPN